MVTNLRRRVRVNLQEVRIRRFNVRSVHKEGSPALTLIGDKNGNYSGAF